MAKVRMLVAATICAVSTLAAVGPSYAGILSSYSSGISTTLQRCTWEPVYISGLLNYRNTCTGQIIPALR